MALISCVGSLNRAEACFSRPSLLFCAICTAISIHLMGPHPSKCVYETGILRHGSFVFGTALAVVTSLRAMATMTSLWGFTSTGGASFSNFPDRSKTPTAPSINWSRHCLIWLGCKSYCRASSPNVCSPRTAARATFDLKSAVYCDEDVEPCEGSCVGTLCQLQAECSLIEDGQNSRTTSD